MVWSWTKHLRAVSYKPYLKPKYIRQKFDAKFYDHNNIMVGYTSHIYRLETARTSKVMFQY